MSTRPPAAARTLGADAASGDARPGVAPGYVRSRNLAQRKPTEEELRASEQRLRILFEYAPDAYYLHDLQGRFVDSNRAGEELVGYRREELIGRSFLELNLLSPEDRAKARARLAQSARGEATGLDEITLNRKDGSRRTVEVRAYPIQVRAQVLVLGIARDITGRKRAEEELRESREQLRALAGRLQAVREEERARLAREIHDVLAQELTLLKLDSLWLRRRLGQPLDEAGQRVLKGQTDKMVEVIDRALESAQRIATELRPVVLDTLGLCAAIEWLARDFQTRTQIACQAIVPDGPLALDPDRSTALFRIFQEALANVARHAVATQVQASLQRQPGEIVLTVQDNGCGIPAPKLDDPHSVGLRGMRERAQLLGGHCQISGLPGQGTTIQVRLPLPPNQPQNHTR
jgi:PAS domain S-box-containing protein